MYFRENLKYLLKETGVKNITFGKFIGVSGASIGTYLKGTTPSYLVLIKIAEYFNISIDALLTVNLEEVKNSKREIIKVDTHKLSGAAEPPTTYNKNITLDALLDAKIEEKLKQLLNKQK